MPIHHKTIDINFLRSILAYDPMTGIVSWIANMHFKRKPGDVARSVDQKGYARVGINRTYFKLHRVAWALHYGEWPADQIDHINRNKLDNRISNLRVVNNTENNRNRTNNRKRKE